MTDEDRELCERLRVELERAFGGPIHIHPRDYLEKTLAGCFGRMPDMSGDQRKRLNSRELAAVGQTVDCLMKALIALSARIAELEGQTVHLSKYDNGEWIKR